MASLAFRKLGTKNGRVDLFTSPSSTAEKFIANILIYIVGAFVIFLLCFQLADITRYLVMYPLNSDLGIESVAPTNLVEQWKRIGDNWLSPERVPVIQSIVFEAMFAGTMFFLGSILWPRRSMFKTGAVLLGMTFAKLIVLAVWAYKAFGEKFENYETVPDAARDFLFSNAFRANLYFDIVFFALCWIAAWIILKRKDVISLKWWK